MSTICLPHRLPVVRRELNIARKNRVTRGSDAKLQQVEEILLSSILDHHPHQDSALSRLLADVDAACDVPLPRDPHSFTPQQTQRLEELLIAVAIGAHERRDSALHDLLHDIDEEARERAEFDMQIDNDPDGMG
jgi:hypothetical protein